MTKFSYITHQKSGVNEISLSPRTESRKIRFSAIDGALIVGFMVAFVGLVFLLSK
jgi:hypothetical protein